MAKPGPGFSDTPSGASSRMTSTRLPGRPDSWPAAAAGSDPGRCGSHDRGAAQELTAVDVLQRRFHGRSSLAPPGGGIIPRCPLTPPACRSAVKRSNDAASAALSVSLVVTHGTPRWPPSGSTAGCAVSPTPPQGGSDYSCSLQGFSYPPRVIPPPIPPQTSLQTLKYHSPLEGESHKPEPNGEGLCGGGYAQGEPKARSCAPSRVRADLATGECRSGGGPTRRCASNYQPLTRQRTLYPQYSPKNRSHISATRTPSDKLEG